MQYKYLVDCCEILDFRRIPITESDRKKGIYPYYGANGVQDYIDDYIFDDELVLLAEDGGNFGSKDKPIAYRVSGKCWVNNHAHVLKPMDFIDVDYLCYSLMFYKVDNLINGSTRQKLNQSAMKLMKIPYYSMDEQKNIVCILKSLQKIISQRQQQLHLLDELVKSQFIEMFGDPTINPHNWDIKKLEEITEIITDGEHNTPKRTNNGIYLLSARNILNHSFQLDDVDYIDVDEYDRISKRIVPQIGDVLISCSGSVGRCCSVKTNMKFQMVRSVALLRFISDIHPIFAEYMISSDYMQKQIDNSKTASSQANLFQGKIAELKGFLPPMEIQNKFADFVKQTDKSKFAIQQSLQETQTLFNSLMQEYFG